MPRGRVKGCVTAGTDAFLNRPMRPTGTRPPGRAAPRGKGQVTNADLAKVGVRGASRTSQTDIPGAQVVVDADARTRMKLGELAAARGAKLPTIPGVQSLSLATRHLNGGRDHFIELVQFAALEGSEDARVFLEVLGSLLPSERTRANYDEVCCAAGIRPSKLVGAVTSAAMEHGADVGNMVYAASHPKVVAAGIAAALKTDGTRDREMLFQHQGFIPIPKSTTISVHASANAQAAAASQSQAAGGGLPSFADDIAAVGAGKIVDRPALGPAGEPETFEAEITRESAPVLADRRGA